MLETEIPFPIQENVEGVRCDRCRQTYFNLDSENPQGCSKCFCYGITDQCSAIEMGVEYITDAAELVTEDWKITDIQKRRQLAGYRDEEGKISILDEDMANYVETYFWQAPLVYLGTRLTGYGGWLRFLASWIRRRGDIAGGPVRGPDVILEGDGFRIGYGTDAYEDKSVEIRVPLNERGWYHLRPGIEDIPMGGSPDSFQGREVTRDEFMRVLGSLSRLLVRAKFRDDQVEASMVNVKFFLSFVMCLSVWAADAHAQYAARNATIAGRGQQLKDLLDALVQRERHNEKQMKRLLENEKWVPLNPETMVSEAALQMQRLLPNLTRVRERNMACYLDLLAYLNNLASGEAWASLMLDATAKSLVPDGFLGFNMYNLGMFDECRSIKARYLDGYFREQSFEGQYCIAKETLTVPLEETERDQPMEIFRQYRQFRMIDVGPQEISVSTFRGLCVPSTCESEDLFSVFHLNEEISLVSAPQCYKNTVEYDTSDRLFLTFLSLTTFVVLVATCVDIYLRRRGRGPITQEGKGTRALVAFSLYTNTQKLFGTEHPKGSITCLNGIRVLSMVWVIYGHVYNFSFNTGVTNPVSSILDITKQPMFSVMLGGTVSTDSFLFLSGFLVTYLLLKEMEKRNGRFDVVMYYVHRYIRLTPIYMVGVWFLATMYTKMGSGPLWRMAEVEKQACRDGWYSNMLYYHNFRTEAFYDLADLEGSATLACLGTGWYLDVDMQLYVLAPLFIAPLYFFPAVGLALLFVAILGSFAVRFALIYANDFTGVPFDVHEGREIGLQHETMYLVPHGRFGVYLIGILAAYVLLRMKKSKIEFRRRTIWIGWILASLFLLYPIFYPTYWYPWDRDPMGVHNQRIFGAIHRNIWTLGLAWVVIACDLGYGGPTSNSLKRLESIETCDCPEGYAGLSCESCAYSYRRVNNTLFEGECRLCDCNRHVETCDPYTGECGPCQHNTIGEHCQHCVYGFYGDATRGTPDDCKPCACPSLDPKFNYSPSCVLIEGTDDYICTQCPPGYGGNHCERCADGYFGNPFVAGMECRPCQCNGNADLSKPGACDHITGECLLCQFNTAGPNCEVCAQGFYGNALQRKCKPCACSAYGSVSDICDPRTGQCQCREGFSGTFCDVCADPRGQPEAACRVCYCDPVGSIDNVCDAETGKCRCNPGVTGANCDRCLPEFYGFGSRDGCKRKKSDRALSVVLVPVGGPAGGRRFPSSPTLPLLDSFPSRLRSRWPQIRLEVSPTVTAEVHQTGDATHNACPGGFGSFLLIATGDGAGSGGEGACVAAVVVLS
ncbi:unnamed protein product [Cyprideis torosa]|uniref:Uncharacterized protein n=1 Tax=Cyprideis torosa TaxID=163714 RepID=A0A7R8ZHI7_9CRUS|nr:unnamed protein product [Cyprideis torosa]CAG0883840.1 unnamed protein product [Cyprideis torosa]